MTDDLKTLKDLDGIFRYSNDKGIPVCKLRREAKKWIKHFRKLKKDKPDYVKKELDGRIWALVQFFNIDEGDDI